MRNPGPCGGPYGLCGRPQGAPLLGNRNGRAYAGRTTRAACLECDNIVEYEILARLAWWAGEHALIEPLLHLAEVEWDHEVWLRERAMTHPLWRCVPCWPRPRPRAALRADFEVFLRRPTTVRRRFSLLVR